MSKHALLSPSGFERWSRCPGSATLAAQLEGESQWEIYNAEGTLAHEVAYRCLKAGSDVWEYAGQKETYGEHTVEVDDEMIQFLQLYLDTVREVQPDSSKLIVEERVDLAALGREDMFGTLDCATIVGDVLHIFDLKYGEGIFVEVTDGQFRYYAAGVLSKRAFDQTSGNPGVRLVRIHVIQPRIDYRGPCVRTLDIGIDELGEWVQNTLMPAADACMVASPALVPGVKQCLFCPVSKALKCPKRFEVVDKLNTHLEEKHPAKPAEYAGGLGDAELVMRLEQWEIIKSLGKALATEAYHRAMKRKLPGRKLVYGKADRAWKDGVEKIDAMAFVGSEAVTKPEMKSPAQMEKLGKKGKDFVTKCAYKPKGMPTLVPDTDSRPEISAPKDPKKVFHKVLETEDA